MRVTARLIAAMLVLTGVVISPAGAQPRGDKGGSAHGHDRSAQAQASPTPSPSATSSSSPSPSPSSTSSDPGSGGGSGEDPGPPGPDTALALTSSASELLVEVGGTFRYTVVVTNTSDETLEDVIVIDEVAPEVDVVAVPVPDDVEAVQLGRSPRGEDIVWNVGRMSPGQEVTLEWIAEVASAGDLMAVNEVTAQADRMPARASESTTFLADDDAVRTSNPPAAPVTKKVVVLGTRLVRAPAAAGAVLPVTGMEVVPYLLGGAALIAIGLFLRAGSRRRTARVAVGALLMTLVVSACVSSAPQDQAADPPPDEVVEPEPDKRPADRVLGTRITRGDEEASEEDPGTAEVTETTDDAQETAPEFVVEEFREVKTVVVPPDEVVAAPLASRAGDNGMSYEWDLESRSMPTAASSTRFYPDPPMVALFTMFGVRDDAIWANVVLTNNGTEPLDVKGNLVHIVSGPDGEIAEFTSEPIDMVLNPGGKVNAEFSYLLPTGSYFSASEFRAN